MSWVLSYICGSIPKVHVALYFNDVSPAVRGDLLLVIPSKRRKYVFRISISCVVLEILRRRGWCNGGNEFVSVSVSYAK